MKLQRMSNLVKRSVFGLIYVALMLGATLSNDPTLFLLVFSVIAFIAIWEYSKLVGLHSLSPLRILFDGLATMYLIALVRSGELISIVIGLIPYALYLSYLLIRSLYTDREKEPTELAKTLFGQFYIAIPLSIAAFLHGSSFYFDAEGRVLLLLMLVCIWLNDTGAFIVGSSIGRIRLFPSLSPKKSWEGFFGGMLFSSLGAWILIHYIAPNTISYYQAVALGALTSICATMGDLFESMLKRNAGVKDSGNIIPGHGGILDRIDSMLFVLPIVTLVYVIQVLYKCGILAL